MKKIVAIIAGAALFSSTAKAEIISVQPFVQSTVTSSSKLDDQNLKHGIGYGLKLRKGRVGLIVSRETSKTSHTVTEYTPSSYTPETPGSPSSYTPEVAGSPSSYTPEVPGTAMVVTPSSYTPEVLKRLGKSDNYELVCRSKYTPEKVKPGSEGTPSSYTPETSGTPSSYVPETAGTPSSYTPESVKEKRISFDVELVQIVPVYYFPVNPDVDLVAGAGVNLLRVNGESGSSFAGVAGLNAKHAVGPVSLNFTALYNYNDSVRDIAGADVKLGDRFLLQAGVEKLF